MQNCAEEAAPPSDGVRASLLAIRDRNRSYRARVARVAIVIAGTIPALFMADDAVRDVGAAFLLNYALPFAWLALLFVFSVLRPNSRFVAPLVLGTAFAGYFLAFYLPSSRQVYVLILFCFPLLAFQLAGFRWGSFAVSLFFLGCVATFALESAGIASSADGALSPITWYIGLLSLFMASVISGFGARQYELTVESLVENLTRDAATELPNRRALADDLERGAISRLFVVRLENSRELESALGSHGGDAVLKNFGELLRSDSEKRGQRLYKLRERDFCVADGAEARSDAELLAAAQRIALSAASARLVPGPLQLRAFVRVCAIAAEGRPYPRLLEMAEASLRAAAATKARVVLGRDASESARECAEENRRFTVLAENIESGTLRTARQPIVDARTGEIVHYELLLRLRDPDGAYVSPIPYLDIAESTGLDDAVAAFVLAEAEEAIEDHGKPVAINIGANQLRGSAFLDRVAELMERDPAKKGMLILELLERDNPSDLEGAKEFIERARSLGCLIAIDDFGSGYANFMNLLFMGADIVKLDGQIVSGALTDERIHGLIEGVVGFCRRSGAKVVAEWIETSDSADRMKALGVDYMQGFYFGRPVMPPSAGKWTSVR
jgi:EAL domain-containing protein (putative c-di-GMP-specific phosphodiesterase class I)/GGDEF domain-containing protein